MEKSQAISTAVILTAFTLAIFATKAIQPQVEATVIRYAVPYICWLVAMLIAGVLLKHRKHYIGAIGLMNQPLSGIAAGLLFSLPMGVGLAVFFEFSAPSITALVTKSLIPGFFEELFFRGFLVGLLIAMAGWRFVSAALIGAVIFGLGHWFQGATLVQAATASLFTAIGGLWFAWLFYRWGHNLWIVITLHTLMNAYWLLWQVDSTAIGNQMANLCRMATILLSIAGTEWYVRRYKRVTASQ
ncbi:CPBP family intramembrane glutamic endopeptidase [Alteromonas sp. AMM-1]|uniref:CPBP family intramembrane glutamic endopeptidase n=1 Tax=Alteromonas sp. AMM-1 TaxID=3394233 RepID=UPI0039A42B6F